MKSLFLCAAVVSAALLTGCSKKPCGPATAPAYANDFVLTGGQVCKATDGGGGVTMIVHYASLDEAALQEQYRSALSGKGYQFKGGNGIYFASKGKDTNMVTTLKDKDRGGASAVVKVFPPR